MEVLRKRVKLLEYGIPLFIACVSAGALVLKSSSHPLQDAMQYQNTQEPTIHLSSPICQTGFWIKQRVDDRDRNGIIIKSRWVFGCAKGKIIYGGKI